MLNFSQSNYPISKSTKQQETSTLPLSFKISQPKQESRLKQMTTMESFNQQSDSGNSIGQKNILKSFSRERLEDQYISFKLRPTGKQNLNKASENVNSIVRSQKAMNFYFSPFEESKDYIRKSQMASLTKSPQFVCKINSQNSLDGDSIKCESGEKQQSPIRRQRYPQNHTDQNSFCRLINESEEIQLLQKYSNLSGRQERRSNKKQLKIQTNLEDSVVNDNFDEIEIYTPYKELRQEFQRQEKLYEKQMKLNDLQQFDSFSQRSPKNITKNFHEGQKVNELINSKQNFANRRVNDRPILNNTQKKDEFFFLTNPSLQQSKKLLSQSKHNEHKLPKTQRPTQKPTQVKEFCFSLSSINIKNEKNQLAEQQQQTFEPYNHKNLFSNSNDHLFFFDSKNDSKDCGSFGSKKVHIRQLVEEFVDQLENLDEKSLNEKNLLDLEDVLESIVFKEPKTKRQPNFIKIEDENRFDYSARSISPLIQNHAKKWQKPLKQPTSSSIATQRKALSQFQNFPNRIHSQQRQANYIFNPPSQIKQKSQQKYCKSPTSSNKSTHKKERQCVYKPNFNMCRSREKSRSQEKDKENTRMCTAFTNLKQKNQKSLVKINPKSSVYVNQKDPKTSRQHIKTESHRPTGWRVY